MESSLFRLQTLSRRRLEWNDESQLYHNLRQSIIPSTISYNNRNICITSPSTPSMSPLENGLTLLSLIIRCPVSVLPSSALQPWGFSSSKIVKTVIDLISYVASCDNINSSISVSFPLLYVLLQHPCVAINLTGRIPVAIFCQLCRCCASITEELTAVVAVRTIVACVTFTNFNTICSRGGADHSYIRDAVESLVSILCKQQDSFLSLASSSLSRYACVATVVALGILLRNVDPLKLQSHLLKSVSIVIHIVLATVDADNQSAKDVCVEGVSYINIAVGCGFIRDSTMIDLVTNALWAVYHSRHRQNRFVSNAITSTLCLLHHVSHQLIYYFKLCHQLYKQYMDINIDKYVSPSSWWMHLDSFSKNTVCTYMYISI